MRRSNKKQKQRITKQNPLSLIPLKQDQIHLKQNNYDKCAKCAKGKASVNEY